METVDRAPVPLFPHSNTSGDHTPAATTAAASIAATSVKQLASSTHPTQSEAADYTPLPWAGYFDSQRDITIPDTQDTFRVYTAGQHGQPLLQHTAQQQQAVCVSVMIPMYYGYFLLAHDAHHLTTTI